MRRRPIRIVFALDSLGLGGTEMNAVRVAEQLDPGRYAITIACFNGSGALRRRLDAAGIRVDVYPVTSVHGLDAVRMGFRLRRMLRREQVDIVHAHDRYANMWAVPWARVAGTRGIIASKRWGTDVSRTHQLGNQVGFALAHRVLGNSTLVGESLVAVDGVSSSRVVVIPNFMDDIALETPPPDWVASHRAQLGLTPASLVVGMVANLRTVKDQVSLLRAVALLKERFPELVVVLIGGGDPAALQLEAETLGIGPMVRLAGAWPNVPSAHWLFDISVLCSLSEGFPNSLVEAMAARRPVVATAVGGIPDAVEHGVTGLLVPPRSPDALAEALSALLVDPALREQYGNAGLVRARQHFTAAAILPQIGTLYETLANGR